MDRDLSRSRTALKDGNVHCLGKVLEPMVESTTHNRETLAPGSLGAGILL